MFKWSLSEFTPTSHRENSVHTLIETWHHKTKFGGLVMGNGFQMYSPVSAKTLAAAVGGKVDPMAE